MIRRLTFAAMAAVLAAGALATAEARTLRWARAGDSLTLTLDTETKSMRQITVDTWLDKPENKVTLEVSFQSLADGTNYAASTVLTIPEKNIEVRIENSNYQKATP